MSISQTSDIDPEDAQAQSEQETEYAIVINGELAVVPHKQVSYEEAVAIAYPVPPSPETRYTVTYRKAEKPHEGSLAPGQTVEVKKDGTIFNVKATGKS